MRRYLRSMVDEVYDLPQKLKINILRIILFSSGSNLTNIIRLPEIFKVMICSEKFPDTAEGLNSPIGRLRGKKILPSCKRQETVVVIVNDDDETETCARIEKNGRVRRPEGNKDRKVERKKKNTTDEG